MVGVRRGDSGVDRRDMWRYWRIEPCSNVEYLAVLNERCHVDAEIADELSKKERGYR
jgi:hypothetical protein